MTLALNWKLGLCVIAAVILYKHKENYIRVYKRQEIGRRSTLRGEHRLKS